MRRSNAYDFLDQPYAEHIANTNWKCVFLYVSIYLSKCFLQCSKTTNTLHVTESRHRPLYGYIYIYIIILYIYTYRYGGYNLACLPLQRVCSTSPPNVEVFSSNTTLCWLLFWNRSYGNVPMGRGISWCFRWTAGSDLCFPVILRGSAWFRRSFVSISKN